MVLGTSAVVAVPRGEPDAEAHLAAMRRAGVLRTSAETHVELSVVVDTRRDPVLSRRLGDCFSYALASCSGEQLLFTGVDLTATDLRATLDDAMS